MPAPKCNFPSYRHHKPTALAVVTIDGRDIYLGPYKSAESRERYDRTIAEWLSAGRRLPPRRKEKTVISIAELVRDFMLYAKSQYLKHGKETSTVSQFQNALKPMLALYGRTPACEFSPRCLKAVREHMIHESKKAGHPLYRKTVNDRCWRIKHVFSWAVAEELMGPEVYQTLKPVKGIRKGRRRDVLESKRVPAVSPKDVEKTLPFLSEQIAAMVNLQLITGMRPGEVTIMRMVDIDREGEAWVYRPEVYKTEHLVEDEDEERVVMLGPKAQEIVRRFFQMSPTDYLFSPKAAEDVRHKRQRLERKSKVQPSQRNRRKPNRTRPPGECYNVASYRRAIHRACKKAKAKRWSPNQLRHTCATLLRKKYGLDAARAVLGHSSVVVTQVYAEIDQAIAAKIMNEVG